MALPSTSTSGARSSAEWPAILTFSLPAGPVRFFSLSGTFSFDPAAASSGLASAGSIDSGATSAALTARTHPSPVRRERTGSLAGSGIGHRTLAPRASRTTSAPPTFALPTIRTGPAQAPASSAAVKTSVPVFDPPSMVAAAHVTPGGIPSADSAISPLNPSRLSATARTGTEEPLRSSGAAGSSLRSAPAFSGMTASRKSGFSRRTDSRYTSRGSSRSVLNRSRTCTRYVPSSFASRR